MFILVIAIIILLAWMPFVVSFVRDRSRYRNVYLLFFAVSVSIFTLTFLAGPLQPEALVVVCLFLLIGVMAVPFFLIHNGIVMLRKEGRSLANMLSLVLGIIVAIGQIAVFTAALVTLFMGVERVEAKGINVVSMLIGASVLYLSLSVLAFVLYTLFLQIIPRKRDFDYVIIHGAGLIDGKRVSKLLADRLDKAIEVYRRDPTPPVLIPSGGKGSDESVSEAEAMAAYLVDKGIPEDMIIKEDRSTTTLENLQNSKAIIEARPGRKYTALVTSNYHVYRALRYSRRIGLKCTGIGSRVAFFYWPSAVIREFIAIHAEKKHLLTFIAGWILFLLPVIPYYLIIK